MLDEGFEAGCPEVGPNFRFGTGDNSPDYFINGLFFQNCFGNPITVIDPQLLCGGLNVPIPGAPEGNNFVGLFGAGNISESISMPLASSLFPNCSYGLRYTGRNLTGNCFFRNLVFCGSQNPPFVNPFNHWNIGTNTRGLHNSQGLNLNWQNFFVPIVTNNLEPLNFLIVRNSSNADPQNTYVLVDDIEFQGVELTITQSVSNPNPVMNEFVTFTVTVTNPSDLNFKNVELLERMSSRLQIINPPLGFSNIGNNTLRGLFDINANSTITRTFFALNKVKQGCPERVCAIVNNADQCLRREACVDLNTAAGLVKITGNRNISEFFTAFGSTTNANGVPIYLDGSLTIDNNFNFNSCNITCSAGSVIVVPNNRVFTNNTTQYQGCDQLWTGIRVGNSGLGFNTVLILDAEYAIDASNQSSLNIVNSQFNDNFTGIRIQGVSTSGGFPSKNGSLSIGGTSFRGINTLLPATNPNIAQHGLLPIPYTGIEVLYTHCRVINIGPVSASNLLEDYGLTLSPNPCRDFVILNVKEKFAKTLKMTITDVNGKSLQSGQLNLDNGFTTIDVRNIPAGSYFMTLMDGEGGQEVVQFVKQ